MKPQTRKIDLQTHATRPSAPQEHQGHPVVQVLTLHLVKKEGAKVEEVGTLAQLPLVQGAAGAQALPADRARAWHELLRWVEHLYIFADSQIQEKQYQNRFKWESPQPPTPQELYDWKRDETTLQRLRPAWQALGDQLAGVIGRPQAQDFGVLYPNLYDDVGFSDDARRVIRELGVVFGPDFVVK